MVANRRPLVVCRQAVRSNAFREISVTERLGITIHLDTAVHGARFTNEPFSTYFLRKHIRQMNTSLYEQGMISLG